ncbi:MAG: hypothetical protein ABR531_01025, partial [Bacteroidales bacterium]
MTKMMTYPNPSVLTRLLGLLMGGHHSAGEGANLTNKLSDQAADSALHHKKAEHFVPLSCRESSLTVFAAIAGRDLPYASFT